MAEAFPVHRPSDTGTEYTHTLAHTDTYTHSAYTHTHTRARKCRVNKLCVMNKTVVYIELMAARSHPPSHFLPYCSKEPSGG